MKIKSQVFLYSLSLLLLWSFNACKERKKPVEKDIVKKPELLDDHITENLKDLLAEARENDAKLRDTIQIVSFSSVQSLYKENSYTPIWSNEGKWVANSDSLLDFISNSRSYGLFPSDYHYHLISGIRQQFQVDTIARKNAVLWARADVLMSDALLQVAKHLKQGRLPYDSLTIKKDTAITNAFYADFFKRFMNSNNPTALFKELEPKFPGYDSLKLALQSFVDSASFENTTYLPYPVKDSAAFYQLLNKRFAELGMIDSANVSLDSTKLTKLISKYQESRKLKVTGKINEATVNRMNFTDDEKFRIAAITLDKYKLLPDTMPSIYVWVNIPSYSMKVVDSDTVVLHSRVIVGSSKTRTPELNSEISNFITYPQWTVPYSIIFKEMLPAIQKDTNYLAKQNLIVVDKDDNIIPPSTIKWSKLSKTYFPYQIKQREGDDNSLGVLKFNFRNKYAVYLHDTNARWLFGKSDRALSHGCVRVQKWQELAHFLVRNDTIKYPADTLMSWIARQEKHVVSGFARVPVMIRYYTCDVVNGKLKFYDDVYAEDKFIREKYFSGRTLN
jgi:L,D-transpeptidase YcbB